MVNIFETLDEHQVQNPQIDWEGEERRRGLSGSWCDDLDDSGRVDGWGNSNVRNIGAALTRNHSFGTKTLNEREGGARVEICVCELDTEYFRGDWRSITVKGARQLRGRGTHRGKLVID